MILLSRQHIDPIGGYLGHKGASPFYHTSACSTSRAAWLPPPRRPAMPSLLERLPTEVQGIMFSKLDYQSLILLSTVNRHFHCLVDPQRMADPADKFEFVMRAAKDFSQHRPGKKGQDQQPSNFECYICFRVRAPEHFDVFQAPSAFFDPHGRVVSDREPGPGDRRIYLRRFCIECGDGPESLGLSMPAGLAEARLPAVPGLRSKLPVTTKEKVVIQQ
ncbi:hypothetical protein FZEAL_10394 [Fusarium zealandicum]|uniref:F-box domain-containing protein n=1 Tax=Fusarium zealandicum TaxID=1053134 RepID=A0A8H4U253_9HYPO|nr:hypothetical protein FZEAL_10394 [Fusarium zealandicum]